MSSKKCSKCGLVNFAAAEACKRCGGQEQQTTSTPAPWKFVGIGVCAVVVLLWAGAIISRPKLSPTQQATAGATQPAPQSSSISYEVESVTLNYRTHNMEIRGTLHNKGKSKPGKVWVWAYFVNPTFQSRGSWSGEPIEIEQPFDHADSSQFVATGHFHWWNNSESPIDGYFARVRASAQSGDAAYLPSQRRSYDTAGAYKVNIVR